MMAPTPDVIIHQADVRTMDPRNPRAQAVAVTGDRITAVGRDADILGLGGPSTRTVDAAGRSVLPGIVDSHNHVRLGSNPTAVSLFGATSLDDIRARIAAHIRASPDADWIEGEGWNYAAVPEGEPTAAMIDEVCEGRPAWLFSYDVHTVWLNSEGLRRWNAESTGAQVPFGTLETDPVTHLPTGWVHDFAVKGIHPRGQRALEAVLPGYSADAQYHRLVRNLRDAARFGITTIVEPQNGLADVSLFERALDEGELRSRMVVAIIHTPDDDVGALESIVESKRQHPGGRLRVGPVKLYIDDVVEPHTAAMLAPYANQPDNSGQTFWPPDAFGRLVTRIEQLGLQTFVHATGDRGIRTALDGFATARALHGPADTRHQIVHVECLDPSDLPRFAELGVVACMQPRHCAPELVRDWRANVGAERERYAWAMRSLEQTGARLAFSSDWNVAQMDPMVGVYTALTRADLDGNNAWNTAETLDLDSTLRAYTMGGAYANFAEHDVGSIEAGKLADLVVWSDDLYAVPSRELLDCRVTHTMVGGDFVFEAE
ncbi:MAG: amidohydrolase [Nocardioidaceae bacterium]